MLFIKSLESKNHHTIIVPPCVHVSGTENSMYFQQCSPGSSSRPVMNYESVKRGKIYYKFTFAIMEMSKYHQLFCDNISFGDKM